MDQGAGGWSRLTSIDERSKIIDKIDIRIEEAYFWRTLSQTGDASSNRISRGAS